MRFVGVGEAIDVNGNVHVRLGSRDKAREGQRRGSGRQRAGSAGKRTARIVAFSASYRAGGVLEWGALVFVLIALYHG